ncbi:MAG: hypothetical protein KDB94_13020 [Acidobacteria bacterium]|nr:hypothetical protein [Acidobacteriota bacterium]MCB9378223.1 hypothetical protein [Holophagales bacterium]
MRASSAGLLSLFLVAPLPAFAGNGRSCGGCAVPPGAGLADVSNPDHVVGDGTPASCTSAATIAAIEQGGKTVFDCGPDPVTIVLQATARIFNDTGPEIVIDGGGLVTLDGGGVRRILYMNTCDPDLHWTTPHCDDQDHPRLTLQNLRFTNGNATGATPDGGGAVFSRGGRIRVVNSRFENNVCDPVGPDVGGGALRVFDQSQDLPVYVVGSTFGGAPGKGNACSNGGALSSIGVTWSVINSEISYNQATGDGANPPQPGTPGGGNGGGICLDGNLFHLNVCGSVLHDDHAPEGGGAIFFVSNNGTGTLTVQDTYIWNCPSDGFWTPPWTWLFFLGSGSPQVVGSTFSGPTPDLFCDGFELGNLLGWDGFPP